MGRITDINEVRAQKGPVNQKVTMDYEIESCYSVRASYRYAVYGLKEMSEIITLGSMSIMASFVDDGEAKGYIASRHVWAKEKYIAYILADMNTLNMLLLMRVPEGWVEQPLEVEVK